MIGIGVIGYGYWGPNLVRNFSEIPGARVVAVCDMSAERLNLVQERYPTIVTTREYKELITNPSVDAVAIATPISTHFKLAMEVISAGKHVLLEKPMTWSSEEGKKLIEESQKRNLILMVDHTFIYMGAVRKIKELVDSKKIGDVYYYDSTRVNLGLFQHDVNVIYDLAVHDISIMDYILGGIKPSAVSVTGKSHFAGQPENVAYITLFFNSNLIAHINVNWLSPVKLRQTLIGGSKKMIVFDDLVANEKVKVYDSGIKMNKHPDQLYKTMVGYRMGDVWSPNFDRTEALRNLAIHFVNCVDNNTKPITDGEMGLRVVKVLEAATKSMESFGKLVDIN